MTGGGDPGSAALQAHKSVLNLASALAGAGAEPDVTKAIHAMADTLAQIAHAVSPQAQATPHGSLLHASAGLQGDMQHARMGTGGMASGPGPGPGSLMTGAPATQSIQ